MAQTDSSSDSPVPPKRFSIKGRTKALYSIAALVLINIGVTQLLARQMIMNERSATTEVKDITTTIPKAGEVSDTNTSQKPISTTTDQPIISTYIVQSGDTLSAIAAKFDISINTIRWANDLTSKSMIKPGDDLVILPVSGVEYTVKKGDTLSGIAVKFDANQSEILDYNDVDPSKIKVGMKLVIPEAEPLETPVQKVVPKKTVEKPAQTNEKIDETITPKDTGAPVDEKTTQSTTEEKSNQPSEQKVVETFSKPINDAILTQGLHDGNAVDFGVPIGTNVRASRGGTVIIAKSSGYNGGYGSYIVINHAGGAQTLYAHLSKVSVSVGEAVVQGQEIGKSGNTGKSSGPHLHYKEMGTGAKNTFAKFKKGTQF